MDGSNWAEVSKEEYENNYTDKINFMYCFDQDTSKIGYYRKEILIEYGKEVKDFRMKGLRNS